MLNAKITKEFPFLEEMEKKFGELGTIRVRRLSLRDYQAVRDLPRSNSNGKLTLHVFDIKAPSQSSEGVLFVCQQVKEIGSIPAMTQSVIFKTDKTLKSKGEFTMMNLQTLLAQDKIRARFLDYTVSYEDTAQDLAAQIMQATPGALKNSEDVEALHKATFNAMTEARQAYREEATSWDETTGEDANQQIMSSLISRMETERSRMETCFPEMFLAPTLALMTMKAINAVDFQGLCGPPAEWALIGMNNGDTHFVMEAHLVNERDGTYHVLPVADEYDEKPLPASIPADQIKHVYFAINEMNAKDLYTTSEVIKAIAPQLQKILDIQMAQMANIEAHSSFQGDPAKSQDAKGAKIASNIRYSELSLSSISKMAANLAKIEASSNVTKTDGTTVQRSPLQVFNYLLDGKDVKEIANIMETSQQFIYNLINKIRREAEELGIA
jgi:hypothetical protein